MRRALWPGDTIGWRFGVTIVASMVMAFLLIAVFFLVGGVWAQPPMDAGARLEGAMAIVRIMEAAAPASRPALAEAVRTKTYFAAWHASDSPTSRWLDAADSPDRFGAAASDDWHARARSSREMEDFVTSIGRKVMPLEPTDPLVLAENSPLRSEQFPDAYYMAVKLRDGSWLVFTGYARNWGLSQSQRLLIWIGVLVASFVVVSTIAARQLTRPIKDFAKAVRQAGANPQAPPIGESGPKELRDVIAAFNEMRAQIEEFVGYRTAMLAAISHDLRTPLTRMRLRGEFIQDKTQQARLFRDVDDMRAMIDGALSFFKGAEADEATRTFDLPGILQSIADDYADQTVEIPYSGPSLMAYTGRPLALKRAFTNLIENAVKYGTPPKVTLALTDEGVIVTIRDDGPGIPEEAMDQVFKPFYRVDKSRNRMTGGVGLGLTAAQAIVRGHGGDIVLSNHLKGGLEARIVLPR